MIANDKNLSYTYNSEGIRTSKTADSATTNYFLGGSTIMVQKSGSDVMWFVYDSDGTRVGFTYNGATYHYLTNAQGDVTGITDSSCNTVVEYTCDAWGKLLNMTTCRATSRLVKRIPSSIAATTESWGLFGVYACKNRLMTTDAGKIETAKNRITPPFVDVHQIVLKSNFRFQVLSPAPCRVFL